MTDPGGGNRRPDGSSWPLIDHRLTALENRVDRGFAEIDHKLDTLAYVRVDVWVEREASHAKVIANIHEDIKTLKTSNKGVWSVVAFGLLSALVLGIARLAGVG